MLLPTWFATPSASVSRRSDRSTEPVQPNRDGDTPTEENEVIMTPRRHTAELAFPAEALIGEGPFWRAESNTLDWVDVDAGLLHQTSLTASANRTFEVSERLGAAVPRSDGLGWIGGVREGVVMIDNEGRIEKTIEVEADLSTSRMNDGACDAAGRFWTGTMDEHGARHRGSLYRVDPDFTVTRMLPGLSLSNGIAWSPDGALLYHVDSTERTVSSFAFDVDRGEIGEPTVVHTVTDATPDGLAVDSDGCLWLAMWGGWQVRRLTPSGTLDAIVHVPTPNVTSIAFCGSTLAITTARQGMDIEAMKTAPHAGSIFTAEVGIDGVAVHRFG